MSGENERLERIERKIDVLSDVVVQLARIEERSSNLTIRLDSAMQAVEALRLRADVAERAAIGRAAFITAATRLLWLAAGAIVATASTYVVTRIAGA